MAVCFRVVNELGRYFAVMLLCLCVWYFEEVFLKGNGECFAKGSWTSLLCDSWAVRDREGQKYTAWRWNFTACCSCLQIAFFKNQRKRKALGIWNGRPVKYFTSRPWGDYVRFLNRLLSHHEQRHYWVRNQLSGPCPVTVIRILMVIATLLIGPDVRDRHVPRTLVYGP
jgi:hypothetical protein